MPVITELTLPTLTRMLSYDVFLQLLFESLPSTYTHVCAYIYTHIAAATDCLSFACTPDELAAVVREIRDNSGLIRSHTHHLVSYKNCFIGRDLVTWLVDKKGWSCKFIILLSVFLFTNSYLNVTIIDG